MRDEARCRLCNIADETLTHYFISCKATKKIRKVKLIWQDISRLIPDMIRASDCDKMQFIANPLSYNLNDNIRVKPSDIYVKHIFRLQRDLISTIHSKRKALLQDVGEASKEGRSPEEGPDESHQHRSVVQREQSSSSSGNIRQSLISNYFTNNQIKDSNHKMNLQVGLNKLSVPIWDGQLATKKNRYQSVLMSVTAPHHLAVFGQQFKFDEDGVPYKKRRFQSINIRQSTHQGIYSPLVFISDKAEILDSLHILITTSLDKKGALLFARKIAPFNLCTDEDADRNIRTNDYCPFALIYTTSPQLIDMRNLEMSEHGTFVLLTTGEFQDDVYMLGRDMERSVLILRIFFLTKLTMKLILRIFIISRIKLFVCSFDAVTHTTTSKPVEDMLRYARRSLPDFKLYTPSNKWDSSTDELERYYNPKDKLSFNNSIYSVYAMCLSYRQPGEVEYLNQFEQLGLSTRLSDGLFEVQEDGSSAPCIPALDWVDGYFLQPRGQAPSDDHGNAAEADGSDNAGDMSADKTALIVSVMESADNAEAMKAQLDEMKLQMAALKLGYESKIKDLESKLAQEQKPAVKWQKKAVAAKRPSANETIELESTPESSLNETHVQNFEDSTYSDGMGGDDDVDISGVNPIDESLLDQEDDDSNDSGNSSNRSNGNIIDVNDDEVDEDMMIVDPKNADMA